MLWELKIFSLNETDKIFQNFPVGNSGEHFFNKAIKGLFSFVFLMDFQYLGFRVRHNIMKREEESLRPYAFDNFFHMLLIIDCRYAACVQIELPLLWKYFPPYSLIKSSIFRLLSKRMLIWQNLGYSLEQLREFRTGLLNDILEQLTIDRPEGESKLLGKNSYLQNSIFLVEAEVSDKVE